MIIKVLVKKNDIFIFLLQELYVILFQMRKSFAPYILPCVAAYTATFLVILPYLCSDWAYSLYFDENIPHTTLAAKGFRLNEQRHTRAKDYFARLDQNSTAAYYNRRLNDVGMDLAIGVVTVRRWYGEGSLGYLSQVMARLDELFKKDIHFKRKALFICNVFAGPGEHTEAIGLSRYFPMVRRFIEESPSDVIQSAPEKEKFDYIYCLTEANKRKPKYILIVEDDAYVNDNFFDVLRLKLNEIEDGSTTEREHARKQWLYLKLFYPERWQGFGWEFGRIIELIGYGLFGGICFLLTCPCLFGQGYGLGGKHRERQTLRWVFVAGFLYFVLLVISIGRPYLLKWRHWSPYFYRMLSAPDCCSPALVFPSYIVRELSAYLEQVTCTINKGLDIYADKFAKQYGYERYVVEPNLCYHIGMLSSLKGVSIWPQEFIFEPS